MVRTHKGTLSCTCPKGFGTKFPSELPLASILIPKLVGNASQVRHSFISFAGSWKDNCGFYESIRGVLAATTFQRISWSGCLYWKEWKIGRKSSEEFLCWWFWVRVQSQIRPSRVCRLGGLLPDRVCREGREALLGPQGGGSRRSFLRDDSSRSAD